ncbi:MAG TPA: aromatic ring-hydroxylating dioxygenase subunit alpha [Steroidobacteraceae bacterium]|nr:aromatic ring-hydroxylating dioxygenase subunit alpha [Steroidobacteraceae bacterium]
MPEQQGAGYNGLTEHRQALPAHYYYDRAHYERELRRIWFRNWIYVGRSEELKLPRSFRTFEIADQRILLVRDDAGLLQGFYNTCRHRGAALCQEAQGQLRSPAIICPYHAWTYDLHGELLRTSSKAHAQGFDVGDYSLYKISVQEWNGCVFIALSDDPPPLQKNFDQPLGRLNNWALGDLRVGHTFVKTMQCNWKIFWENYNECLHCPGVHVQLSQLVPIFGRGLLEERDDPKWALHADKTDPKFKGGLRRGATTWSTNGRAVGPPLPGLTEEDRQAAHVYVTSLPSVFFVGHPDYVRIVRLRPLGPEQTEMCVEYLFTAQSLADREFDMRNAVDFANRVMSEDAQICELNQQGLRAAAHQQGVLMPEEYLVLQFQDWVRAQLQSS